MQQQKATCPACGYTSPVPVVEGAEWFCSRWTGMDVKCSAVLDLGEPEALSLNCDAVAAKPQDFNFGEGYGDAWEIVYPDFTREADAAEAYLQSSGITYKDEPEDVNDPDAWVEEIINQAAEAVQEDPDEFAPMMNYAYPLPGYEADAARDQATKDLRSCVLVLIGGEVFLALAGGGMDLSHHICRAYLSLGYWPPAHFCDWPRAYPVDSISAAYLAAVCAESCRISERWARGPVERIEEQITAFLAKTKEESNPTPASAEG